MSPAGHWSPDPTSWRSVPRPLGWKSIRAGILDRDGHQCVWVDEFGQRCQQPATDVDHIGDPDDHSPANLRSLCGWHHRQRTARQAAAASAAKRHAQLAAVRKPHPGLRSR